MGIPLSATLTSPFSRETEYSSALSDISSMRGDYLGKPPLIEEVARSAGGVPGEQCSPLQIYLFKGAKTPLPCRASPL